MYGQSFPSLSHRFIHSLMFPAWDVIPVKGLSDDSCRQYTACMRGMLETLYNDPGIIGMPLIEDTYGWQERRKGEEQFKAYTKSKQQVETKFWQFAEFLIKIGVAGELDGDALRIDKKEARSKPRLGQLEAVGFEVQDIGERYRITNSDFPDMFAAYKRQAECVEQKHTRRGFMLAILEDRAFTARECFGTKLPYINAIETIEDYCRQNGYRCLEVEWCNPVVHWVKEYKKGKRILFTVFPEPWSMYQAKYSVRVSDFQAVFAVFDGMSAKLREMIFTIAGQCRGAECKYCVQTDKTGTKPLAVSQITLNGESKAICSYYPWWSLYELDDEKAGLWIELMTAADRVLGEKYGVSKK